MLQVARLAPTLLDESTPLVVDFFRRQLNDDGGFADREGKSDLYYTVFGIEGLAALQVDVPWQRIANYLKPYGDGADLDLIHLTCLARCWSALPIELQDFPRDAIIERLLTYRAADGGYHSDPGMDQGTVYGCFVVVGALQDLQHPIPDPSAILACVEGLETEDGSFANQHDVPMGLTPPTAAAAALYRQLGGRAKPQLGEWLLSQFHPQGGFIATQLAPLPDLLSTATALHALAGIHVDFSAYVEPCLDFIDTLWTNRGGFYGNWEDDHLDCEYTYYGLLALGHLSL